MKTIATQDHQTEEIMTIAMEFGVSKIKETILRGILLLVLALEVKKEMPLKITN